MTENEKTKPVVTIMDDEIERLPDKSKKLAPIQPRPAATCILLRERNGGLELFLTKRLQQMKFASGHHVFPGGKVEKYDGSQQAISRSVGRTTEELTSAFKGIKEAADALRFWLAALRELFEEAGVLLAIDGQGQPVHQAKDAELQPFREALLADEIDFYEALEERGWRLDLSQLDYFDHWVTPEYVPIRFDTRFFLARMPEGATAVHWPGEADEGFWIGPQQALDRWEKRELMMIPPTFMSIRRLLDMPEILEWIRG